MSTLAEYKLRDRRLLEHAARYRVLLPPAASAAFGNGKPIPHAFSRLVEAELLQGFPRALPGGLSYYVLSTKGCAAINAPSFRATPPQGAALDLAIATSFFCHLDKHRRYRLDPQEAGELFEASLPQNVSFVVTDELGERKVLRVVQAAAQLAADAVRHVRVLVEQTARHPQLRRWLENGQLGFAVFGPTAASVKALEKSIERSKLRRECPLVVALGPDAEHLAAALKHQERP